MLLLQTSVTDLPANKIGAGILAILFGIGLIYVGRRNLITGVAEETGRRARITNRVLKQDNVYTGGKAKTVGVIRIVGGVLLVAAGIVMLFFNDLMPF